MKKFASLVLLVALAVMPSFARLSVRGDRAEKAGIAAGAVLLVFSPKVRHGGAKAGKFVAKTAHRGVKFVFGK